MFDGSAVVPKSGYDSAGEDVRLHISLLVDITRGKGCDSLECVCSAWPDCLEIQKVYIFKPDGSLSQPYMGPNFKYDQFSFFRSLCFSHCLHLHIFERGNLFLLPICVRDLTQLS